MTSGLSVGKNNSNNETEQLSKMTSSSLGGFLDNTPEDNKVESSAEPEVYIRADGKKVRRIKKKVVRTISSSSVDENDTQNKLQNFMKHSTPSQGATPSGAMSVDAYGNDSKAKSKSYSEGEVYVNKDGKKVRRVKRSSSATVSGAASAAGDLSGMLGSNGRKPTGSSATVGGEGEIYINKDGKKVRRVRRTVSRSSSASVQPGALDSKLGSSAASAPKGSAATVGGEGEIYINKDGKKVRRVKRSKTTSVDSLGGFMNKATPPARSVSSDNTSLSGFLGKSKKTKNTNSSNSSLSSFLGKSKKAKKSGSSNSSLGSFLGKGSKSKKMSGSATVAGSTPTRSKSFEDAELGEVYINKDGKKVRRVKKKKAGAASVAGDAQSSGLAGLLDSGRASSTKGSAATVAGDRVASNKSSPSSTEESEIYIRPDGKKVRRVKKVKTSGAASVDGTASSGAGEVYINKDGKKVRRVRRTSSATVAPSAAPNGLDGLLGSKSDDSAKSASGSATVAGSAPSKSATDGEVYIRADGKKVRRVRKTSSSASISPASVAGDLASTSKEGTTNAAGERVLKQVPEGEIIIRADGKKVLRRRKSPQMGSSGDSAGSKSAESEVYRRADGKLVRRVKRTASTPAVKATTTQSKASAGDLAGYIDRKAETNVKKQASETATVVGDGPAPSIADLLKSKDATSATIPTPTTPQTAPLSQPPTPQKETPLRGVTLTTSEEDVAGQYRKLRRMGMPDAAIEHRMTSDGVASHIMAAVLGGTESTGERSEMNGQATTVAPASGTSAPSISSNVKLTPPEEEVASSYAKMKRMGLPDDAIRHKMNQDGVDARIIAFVLDEATPAKPVASETPSPMASDIKLSSEEENVASGYSKMKRMGLPDDAIKHKMVQDGVDPKIMAYVLGEPLAPSSVPLSNSAESTPPVASVPKHETPSVALPAAPAIQLSTEEEAIASSYSKMKRMGLPDDAVKHKMNQDGVDAKIVAYVLGEPWSEPALTSPTPSTAVPTRTPTATPPSTGSSAQLTTDEESIASTYTKMKKMGLPDDAVRHKMAQDGVDPKIAAFVLGESWTETPHTISDADVTASSGPQLSSDEEVVASSYSKMKKMGLPDDAVRHKMQQDGVHPKIVAFVLGESWDEPASIPFPAPVSAGVVELSPEEETIAASYNKMKKMGLPEDAVRHKMQQDGVDAKIVSVVMGEATAAPAAPSASKATPASTLSDEEETVATKYRKLLKMGMPLDAVAHKMDQDGIDQKIRNIVLNQPASDSASKENSASYNLVMSDDEDEDEPQKKQSSLAATLSSNKPALKRQNSSETIATVLPHETFAVKLDSEDTAASNQVETKYMTLDDIARLSGQSRDELEKMIVERRNNDQQIPRFVLQPLEKSQKPVAVPLFPVQISQGNEAAPVPAPTATNPTTMNPALAHADPNKLKEVNEGEEVVDSALANAARAVAALGESDMSSLLAKLQAGDMGKLLEKLQEAEKRQKKLEKQLAQAGVAIAEDIDYAEAKAQVETIAKRMNEIGGSDIVLPDKEEQNRLREEYFKLEQQMERYNTALMLSEEYQAEQDRLELQWEEDNRQANLDALRQIRRHMPVKIRHMSEAELCNTPSPNGKFLPRAIAKKFKRTNVLQMLRLNPDDIERMHPSTLESMRVTGLTLTERRALYLHFQPLGPKWEKNKAEKMTERKWTWYKMMKNNFKENLAPYLRHVAEYGPPENHPYASRDNPSAGGCPLIGKQCPIKADKMIDYDGDYGWTPEAEYEVSQVTKADADDPGAKAMQEALELAREKKSNERADLLKKHYKGKLLQVSKANGSCEAMDEAMDKAEFATLRWIEYIIEKGENESDADKKKEVANFNAALNELKLSVLDFCQRSGMQISGKKKAGGDGADIRSAVECGLAEELYECSQELFKFILKRMKEIKQYDTRVDKTIELLEGMLGELHNKNVATLQKLGVKRPDRSRKWRKNEEMRKEVEEKMKPKEEEVAAEESPAPRGPPGGGGGRGGLLDAIQGRGRGRGGGRGDLMSAISGRGRGGRGGGRGDLMAAISGRGRGGGGGNDAGGRGGLLAAIQGRGRGGGRGGDGGRGGLLAAIQARGGG